MIATIFKPSTWPGSRLDWVFSVFSFGLVAAGYYDAWINRQGPDQTEHVWVQAAWLVVTLLLITAGISGWLREKRLDAIVPDGYALSAIGCLLFGAGIFIGFWWGLIFGLDKGVPAVFRPSNLLQIAGTGLIVTGPLRAAIARGELAAGPTAVWSAALLLASITFFSQFDHPYVDEWATGRVAGSYPPAPPLDTITEIIGVLGLIMQTTVVISVILMTLRQIRLPVGSVTYMLTGTAALVCTQKGTYQFVLVAIAVGVMSDAILLWARPRADRLIRTRIFAGGTGALLAGVYLLELNFNEGIWWSADMTWGSIVACFGIGWLISYLAFPEREMAQAAAVLFPAPTAASVASAPDITDDRVEHALKVLHNSRDLAESPLVGMNCAPGHNATALRQVIEQAIESIRTSSMQVDAQAGEILSLYYVRRIGGHFAVETRVGLSRAAYFNRRSYGVRRLVDRLKDLEESATPV